MQPFISFYTPTYRRPQALARCLASVGRQSLVDRIEQIVIPDHVGRGVAGMYAQVPQYVSAVHGEYVHFLADDDELVSSGVVKRLHGFIEAQDERPAVVIVRAEKGRTMLPMAPYGAPAEGRIDLGCFVVRGDLWRDFAGRGAYGQRYEGDYDFGKALWDAGHPFNYALHIVFVRGAVMNGAAEAAS